MSNMTEDIGGFYQALPVFSEFAKVSDAAAFQPLPDDWVLLASDIVRSRDAIAAGRYKHVNMVAAAVVSAVLNAAGRIELPFVFGGDGALVVVPPALADAAGRALVSVRAMAREAASLDLRIAAIPVADLRAEGADLRVAKFELSRGNNLAMFSGGGIELAETILKDEARVSPYRLAEPAVVEPAPLDGLSCRWEPLPACRGRIATLLLRPASGRMEDLSAILDDLRGMLGIDLTGADPASAPVRRSSLKFRFPPAGLKIEARMIGWRRSRWRTYLTGLAACAVVLVSAATGRRIGPFEPERYLPQVALNTDFRKFDDMLRLVLDLDGRELEALTAYLDKGEAAGHLIYGLHLSDEALMTCLVFSLEENRHIHFIDGADGGYARAAQDFKRRLAEQASGAAA